MGDVRGRGQGGRESICFGVVVGLGFDEETVREGGEVEVQGGEDGQGGDEEMRRDRFAVAVFVRGF